MKTQRSVGAEPYAPKNINAITGGGGRDDTCDHGLSRSWKVEACQKKREKLTRRRDYQWPISSKDHVKYETTQTCLSVTYQHDRLHLTGKRPQQRSQRQQQQQSTPPIFLQRVFSREENAKCTMRYWDEYMPLTGFSRGHCLLATTFGWSSLTTGGTIIFPLVLCVENVFISCFLVQSLPVP